MSKEKKNKNRRIEVAFFFDKHLPNFLHDFIGEKALYTLYAERTVHTFGANCIQRTYTFPTPNHRPTTKFCFSKVPPLQAVLRDVTYESGQSRRPASRRRYYFLGLG